MHEIAKSIGTNCTWRDVQFCCWQSGTIGWQGSKMIIANCLKKLPTATTEQERKKLAETIANSVNRIYYLGKEMRDRVLEITKSLENIKK